MANRWNRNPPYGGGYMGSGVVGGVGFYMGGPPPNDRRPYNTPTAKPFYGGYREDNYNRRPERRDDFRGGKRGPQKGRSPAEKRYHGTPPSQRKDHRPFGKRHSSFAHYEVKIPKGPFNKPVCSISDVRHCFPRLNIAPDFYECSAFWIDSFPLHNPLNLATGTDYHVFHRDVQPPVENDLSLLNPPDADYSYSARVMLMACPQEADLYRATCRMADDANDADKLLPTKSMHFLVGGRAKSETMALGGPWSPSMDGPDPSENPQTLINTAVRTFKGYTGLDLSSCTEWIRFMEIKYYRTPGTKAPAFHGPDEEREVVNEGPEVVVIFIPNATHLMPSEEQWVKTKEYYTTTLEKLLTPEVDGQVEQPEAENCVVDASMEEQEEAAPQSDIEPTHYAKLDVNTMKVSDLRNELAARQLDTKGLKANLVTRLQSALDEERKLDAPEDAKQDEEMKTEQTPTKTTSPTASTKDDSKELTEKERRRMERFYRVGDKPVITIHPNKAARGERFDCHRVSVHSLLDYRAEDQKEQNYEVSLFVEVLNAMHQRDAAFQIFKDIHDAPEKELKAEQDVKLENGIGGDEPDAKRRRNDSQNETENQEEPKVRRLQRTVKPALLYAFTYFDVGKGGYIREHDLCEILHALDLQLSRSQIKKLVSKVITKRDHVEYHHLTDAEIVEGDERDVVTMKLNNCEDTGAIRMLALGNRALFDVDDKPVAAKIVLGGDHNEALLSRLEEAESVKQRLGFQFSRIKDELDKTRAKLNAFKDVEDQLRADNRDLTNRLKTDQKQMQEYKSSSTTYSHMLRTIKDSLDRVTSSINKQFDKERAKREADRAAAEAEKASVDGEANKDKPEDKVIDKVEEGEKCEEKEWEVVDAV